MKRHHLLGLAIAAAAILAACSSRGAPSAPAPTVDGRTYLSTDVQGAALVPGTRISLAFKDGNLNFSGGCNLMGGAYKIDGDRLVTTQLFMTEMACEEPRMAQDEWLSRLLGGATIALAGDELTLDSGAIRLTLLDRSVATPDLPIEGTRWVVDGIASGDAVSSVPTGVTASIRIVGGHVDVEAGCNTGGGPVEFTVDELTFGPIALTKKACEPGAMAVERTLIAVLTGAVAYTIQADVLALDAGDAGLMFRAAP